MAVAWHQITQRDTRRPPLSDLVIGEISAQHRIPDAAARGAGVQLQQFGDLGDRNLILAERLDRRDGFPRLDLDRGVDTFGEQVGDQLADRSVIVKRREDATLIVSRSPLAMQQRMGMDQRPRPIRT